MTFWPLLVCTGLYVVTAISFARDGNSAAMRWPMWASFGCRGGNVEAFDTSRQRVEKSEQLRQIAFEARQLARSQIILPTRRNSAVVGHVGQR